MDFPSRPSVPNKEIQSKPTSWKQRLTADQLQKKRLADRINQRKVRSKSKQNFTRLEHTVDLLLSGDHEDLIRRLLEENALLSRKIEDQKAKLDLVYAAVKPSRPDGEEEDVSVRSPSELPQTGPVACGKDCRDRGGPSMISSPQQIILSGCPSIFFQIAAFTHSSRVAQNTSINHLLEAITAWKLSWKHRLTGIELVVKHLGIMYSPLNFSTSLPLTSPYSEVGTNGEPLDHIVEQALSKTFLEDILGNIIHGPTTHSLRCPRQGFHDMSDMSDLAIQRRVIVRCAYETLIPFYEHYHSALECMAVFWAQFKLFTFLVYSTAENLARIPSWHRPCVSQFTHFHPGYLDFLLWPQLREKLSSGWKQYDMHYLVVSLIRHFRFTAPNYPLEVAIRVSSDGLNIEVDDAFEAAISDVTTFFTHPDFAVQYPELAAWACIQPTSYPGPGVLPESLTTSESSKLTEKVVAQPATDPSSIYRYLDQTSNWNYEDVVDPLTAAGDLGSFGLLQCETPLSGSDCRDVLEGLALPAYDVQEFNADAMTSKGPRVLRGFPHN